MPICSVKNCKSRSGYALQKNAKFFSFPQDPKLRLEWIKACNLPENLQIKYERVCELHFTSDCIKDQWTHRRKGVQPRIMKKLKTGSIPTEMLNLPESRWKRDGEKVNGTEEKKDTKKSACGGIPDYAQLVQSFHESRQLAAPKVVTPVTNNTAVLPLNGAVQIATKNCITQPVINNNYVIQPGINNNCVIQPAINSNCIIQPTVKRVANNEAFGAVQKVLIVSVKDTEPNEETTKLQELVSKLQKENAEISAKNAAVLELNSNLVKEISSWKNVVRQMAAKGIPVDVLKTIFTSGQIKKLQKNKRVKWTTEDIVAAIAVRCTGVKAYNHWRQVRNMPLPAPSTLRKWISDFNVKPGILSDVLNIMDVKGRGLTPFQKITVLTFNEVYLSNMANNNLDKNVTGKMCQVSVVHGLFSPWRQPVFYDFAKPMTKGIIFSIITELYKKGFTVVAITSNICASNAGLWKDLGVGVQMRDQEIQKTCSFAHPSDPQQKIFVFAEISHMLKLLRNHFIDDGFFFNGQSLDKSILEETLQLNSDQIPILFQFDSSHLYVKGAQREEVKLVAQVFSSRNARALHHCGVAGYLNKDNWQGMANMLQIVGDWFELFNGQLHGMRVYAIESDIHRMILNEMDEFITNLQVGDKMFLLPFQKGILISNESLRQLLPYIKEKFQCEKVECIFTKRLSLEVLENFVYFIKGMGSTNDFSSPIQFQQRLKMFIFGQNYEKKQTASNTSTESENVQPPVEMTVCENPINCDVINEEEENGEYFLFFKEISEDVQEEPQEEEWM